jgi:hypothetical protein
MGESSRRRNVVLLLAALQSLLADEGLETESPAALEIASAVYAEERS